MRTARGFFVTPQSWKRKRATWSGKRAGKLVRQLRLIRLFSNRCSSSNSPNRHLRRTLRIRSQKTRGSLLQVLSRKSEQRPDLALNFEQEIGLLHQGDSIKLRERRHAAGEQDLHVGVMSLDGVSEVRPIPGTGELHIGEHRIDGRSSKQVESLLASTAFRTSKPQPRK
jgi:hypothetical protein